MDNELSVFEQFKSETDRNDWEYSEKWYSEEYVEWLEAKVANSSNDIQNVMISSLPNDDDIRGYALDWCEKFGNETGDEETMRSIAYTSYRRGCQRVNRILTDES